MGNIFVIFLSILIKTKAPWAKKPKAQRLKRYIRLHKTGKRLTLKRRKPSPDICI